MDISSRIKQIRGNLRQVDFAKTIGVSKNTVGRWDRGEQKPGYDELVRILEVYPDINPTWLLTGEGVMIRGEGQPRAMPDPDGVLGLLEVVIAAIEKQLAAIPNRTTNNEKEELRRVLYNLFGKGEEDRIERAVLLRLVHLVL